MARIDNVDVKLSENEAEVEDSSRTANCLRGRLLAERMASRNAKEEAEQLEIKLLEMERQLKQELKSRSRAERKLRFLTKRLEFINSSSCASDESEQQFKTQSPKSKGSPNLELSLWVPTQDSSTSSFEPKNDESEKSELSTHSGENSMALVPVTTAAEDGRVDPKVLEATVKEVLESLRRAKEQLRCSMERRSMSRIKVG